jgi:hypothetical protein
MKQNKLEKAAKEFHIDCPGFSGDNKCSISNRECVYAKKGTEKKYCMIYSICLLGRGRYSK